MRQILTLIGMMIMLGATAAGAADEDAAAIIVEVDGSAPPGLEEFAAVQAGAAFVLPGATSVAFNHLATCQTVRVKGGILIINEADYAVPGGEVLSTEKSECPEEIRLETEGVVGGVRLRSFGKKAAKRNIQPTTIRWSLPVRPVIFLRGKSAASVSRIKVLNGGLLILDVTVSRDPVIWPSSAPALLYDTPYLLRLEDVKKAKISETWVRTMAKDAGRTGGVVFLHVD